jgi:hypothetical protein
MTDRTKLLAIDSVEDLKAAFNGDIDAMEAALSASESRIKAASNGLLMAIEASKRPELGDMSS